VYNNTKSCTAAAKTRKLFSFRHVVVNSCCVIGGKTRWWKPPKGYDTECPVVALLNLPTFLFVQLIKS